MNKILNRVLLIIAVTLSAFLLLSLNRSEMPEKPASDIDCQKTYTVPETEEIKILSGRSLAVHFPDERPEVRESVEVEEVLVEHVVREPGFTRQIKFISSAVRNGEKSFYFKDSSSGRIYEVMPGSESDPWNFLSDQGDHFLMKNNEIIWKVRK